MTPMLSIAIEFSDGSKVKYAFPAQSPNSAARQMKLEDFFKGRHLVLQSGSRLIMHPMENIKTIEMSSGGGDLEGVRLPLHTIRDAKPQDA
jgi:hypothetical protein